MIPNTYRVDLIPGPEISVGSFLSMAVPAKRTTLVHITASKQFTSDVPLMDLSSLKTRKISSLEFVEDAAKAVGQTLLNDAQCILHPDYKGAGIPL